jgi:cytochrome c oxidase subunit 2
MGAAENLSIFDPASSVGPAESIRSLSVLVFAITGFIFVVVEGVLLYCTFRFRQGAQPAGGAPGETPGPPAAEPPQVYGSKPIEIAWTAAPALIVFVLVLVTARSLWEVNPAPPAPHTGDNALFVTVTGRQWWWEYTYDHYDGRPLGFVTANELHVPATAGGVRRPVYLTLLSADVCHSFWVPRLAGKTDLIPGKTNSMWFRIDAPGLYLGQCAEYCGTQHAGMLLRVYADSPSEFDAWLKNQGKDKKPPSPDDPDARAFFSQTCVSCHRVRGTSARGTYAPDLTHLMSRDTLAAGLFPNTEVYLRSWVENPQRSKTEGPQRPTMKPGCLMPAFGLSERDRDAVVRYLLTLD